MSFQTILLIVVIAVAAIICGIGFRKSPTAPLNIVGCILGTLSPLAVAAFGAFGFLASYELASPDRWPWQIGYGVLVTGAVLIAARVVSRCSRQSKR